MNDEENAPRPTFSGQAGQFFQVPPPPFRDGIGEHGDPLPEEGAGLHLQEVFPLPPREEKIETAPSDRNLRPEYPVSLETGNPAGLDQLPGDPIRQVGMEQDGTPFPFHGDHRVVRLPGGGGTVFDKIEERAGKEEFQKPARVRQIGPDRTVADAAFHDEAIGTAEVKSLLKGREKRFHTIHL